MRFDPRFLDQLRSRLTLSEVVGDSVSLSKKGREHLGLCPFHKEKTPSFTVNDDKEFYHCFGCGAHGDAIRFLVDHRGFTFLDAVKELAQRTGLSLPEESGRKDKDTLHKDSPLFKVMEEAGRWFHNQLFTSSAGEAQSYLESRGFSPQDVKELHLGYAPRSRQSLQQVLLQKGFNLDTMIKAGLLVQPDEGKDPYDRFRDRIMFPIHDSQGRLVAFGGRILGDGEPKYLNSPETPIFSKGHLLYGFHHARTHLKRGEPVIVGEGYMDVLSLRKAGYAGALAPMGTALTEDQISLLWRLSFEPILCFDGDSAGLKAAQRAADRALPLLRPGYTLKFAHLPSGEDPDSMIRSGRKSQLSQLLTQSQPMLDILWSSLAQDKDLKSPEQQALLLKQIDQITKKAENNDVGSSFRAALKEKFYHLRNHGRFAAKSKVKLSRPQNFFDKSSSILLAILLNHPHLLDDVGEQLASLDVVDEDLKALKDALLAFAVQKSVYSVESLMDYLFDQGLASQIKSLHDSAAVKSYRYAHVDVSREDALFGWNDVFKSVHKTCLEEEIHRLQSLLAKEMTESNWRRLVEVKKMLQESRG